jgi:hypothetical protein
VTWVCRSEFTAADNPGSEWRGTRVAFEVDPRRKVELLGTQRDVTVVRLAHSGWPADARWHAFCNAAWGHTLNESLKHHCEEETR